MKPFNFGVERSTPDIYINQREAANLFFSDAASYKIYCRTHNAELTIGSGTGEKAINILSMLRAFTTDHLKCDLEFGFNSSSKLLEDSEETK